VLYIGYLNKVVINNNSNRKLCLMCAHNSTW